MKISLEFESLWNPRIFTSLSHKRMQTQQSNVLAHDIAGLKVVCCGSIAVRKFLIRYDRVRWITEHQRDSIPLCHTEIYKKKIICYFVDNNTLMSRYPNKGDVVLQWYFLENVPALLTKMWICIYLVFLRYPGCLYRCSSSSWGANSIDMEIY